MQSASDRRLDGVSPPLALQPVDLQLLARLASTQRLLRAAVGVEAGAVDAEEQLYQSAHDSGITCITVSQRLGLEQFHSQELRFGSNNEQGWSMHAVNGNQARGGAGVAAGWHKARAPAVAS